MKKNFYFRDPDFLVFLQELLESRMLDQRDDIDKMCIGISQKVIDEGWDVLSVKQQNVLAIMCEKICYDHCTHCSDSIPWCEQMFAIQNDGMCSHCDHVWNNMEKE